MSASDRRIGERTPWNLAQEIALQEVQIGKPKDDAKSRPSTTRDALMKELIDLVGNEEAERLIAQAKAQPAGEQKEE
jgi:hypothetical protein